nr:hypothetical protein GCM10010200_065990 [Actinomadura rugatobispora]
MARLLYRLDGSVDKPDVLRVITTTSATARTPGSGRSRGRIRARLVLGGW